VCCVNTKTYSWFYIYQLTFKRWVSYTGSSGLAFIYSVRLSVRQGAINIFLGPIQKNTFGGRTYAKSSTDNADSATWKFTYFTYLCRKILNKAPCRQILLLVHRPSQLTFSLSALVHSSIFLNSISNSPLLLPSIYIPIRNQLSYSSTPCNVNTGNVFCHKYLPYVILQRCITCTAVEVRREARPRLFCGSLILRNLAGEAENLRIHFLDKSSERKADVLLTTRSAPWAHTHNIRRT
jgi:hypothetical protein